MAGKAGARSKSSELRFHPRYRLEVRIAVATVRPDGVLSLWGRCSDISVSGLGCTLAGELLEGESVTVELTLPPEPVPMKARAVVRHRAGFHYGLELLFLTPEQEHAIHLLTRSLPRAA